jgi:hypothetical protein
VVYVKLRHPPQQRQVPKVLVIEPEQIEAIEGRVSFAPSHVSEHAPAVSVQANNFSIHDGILNRNLRQGCEALELILFSPSA